MNNIQDMLVEELQKNPTYKQILDKVGDRDPKEVFFEECKKMGVNPSKILDLLKGVK